MKKIFLYVVMTTMIFAVTGCNKEQNVSVQNEQTEVADVESTQAEEVEELRQQIAELETQIGELEQQIEVLETQVAEMEAVSNTVTVVNPIREVTREEMLPEVGIPLKVPDDATDVVYHVIAGESMIAQVKFNVNDVEYCLRACATGEFEPVDISGLYYTWEVQEEVEVGYCVGEVFFAGEVGYVAWLDIVPGLNYNLSVKEGATKEILVEMANTVFVEVQGDS